MLNKTVVEIQVEVLRDLHLSNDQALAWVQEHAEDFRRDAEILDRKELINKYER